MKKQLLLIGNYLHQNLDKVDQWLRVARSFVTILAFICAGYWAIFVYSTTQAPSLSGQYTRGDVQWTKTAVTGYCIANFDLTISNLGKNSLTVSNVRMRGWHFREPDLPSGFASYIDFSPMEQATPFDDRTLADSLLVRGYAPGETAHETYSWVLKSVPQTRVIFRADIQESGGGSLPPVWKWGEDCGLDPTSPAPTQTNAASPAKP